MIILPLLLLGKYLLVHIVIDSYFVEEREERVIYIYRYGLLSCSFGIHYIVGKDRRGRDHTLVGFTTTCAISVYHH